MSENIWAQASTFFSPMLHVNIERKFKRKKRKPMRSYFKNKYCENFNMESRSQKQKNLTLLHNIITFKVLFTTLNLLTEEMDLLTNVGEGAHVKGYGSSHHSEDILYFLSKTVQVPEWTKCRHIHMQISSHFCAPSTYNTRYKSVFVPNCMIPYMCTHTDT